MRHDHDRFVIVDAQQAHVSALKGRLRRQDSDEVLAATGLQPNAGLQRSFSLSSMAWAVMRDARVIAVFGVGDGPVSGTGSPWLLGSEELAAATRGFVLYSRQYLGEMLRRYGRLMNWVDARNSCSVRWLRWCGFSVEMPRPYGPFRLPFHAFYMGGEYVHYS